MVLRDSHWFCYKHQNKNDGDVYNKNEDNDDIDMVAFVL